jgi:hypothetical protein
MLKKYHTYSLCKVHVEEYDITINTFISKIEGLRVSIIDKVNAECDRKIKYLRELDADLNSKFERLSIGIAASNFSEIVHYEGNEKGIPDKITTNETEVELAIGKIIYFGNQNTYNNSRD